MTETEFVDISKITIKEIDKKLAKPFIENNHYTGKMSSTKYSLGVFYKTKKKFFSEETETMIGCLTYGHPISFRTIPSISELLNNDNVLELTRLVILDGHGKNIESYAIGQSFKWLKEHDKNLKVLISYADPEQGHTGGIYRATNWLYQGCGYSKLMADYSLKINEDDEWIHSRTVGSRYGNKSLENLAKQINRTFWRKEEPAKHRYIYFLCDRKEKKELLKSLKLPVFEYGIIKPIIPLIQKVIVENGKVSNIEIIQGRGDGSFKAKTNSASKPKTYKKVKNNE